MKNAGSPLCPPDPRREELVFLAPAPTRPPRAHVAGNPPGPAGTGPTRGGRAGATLAGVHGACLRPCGERTCSARGHWAADSAGPSGARSRRGRRRPWEPSVFSSSMSSPLGKRCFCHLLVAESEGDVPEGGKRPSSFTEETGDSVYQEESNESGRFVSRAGPWGPAPFPQQPLPSGNNDELWFWTFKRGPVSPPVLLCASCLSGHVGPGDWFPGNLLLFFLD